MDCHPISASCRNVLEVCKLSSYMWNIDCIMHFCLTQKCVKLIIPQSAKTASMILWCPATHHNNFAYTVCTMLFLPVISCPMLRYKSKTCVKLHCKTWTVCALWLINRVKSWGHDLCLWVIHVDEILLAHGSMILSGGYKLSYVFINFSAWTVNSRNIWYAESTSVRIVQSYRRNSTWAPPLFVPSITVDLDHIRCTAQVRCWEPGVSLHDLVPKSCLLCIPFLNAHVSHPFCPTTLIYFCLISAQTTPNYSFSWIIQ